MALQPRTLFYTYQNKLPSHKFGGFWSDRRKDFPRTGPQNTGKTLTYIQAPSGIQIHEPVFGAMENIMHGKWCHIVTIFVKNSHFYLPINAINCIKLRMLKSTCINILKDN